MNMTNEARKNAIIMLCRASRKAQRKTLVYVSNATNYHYSTLSKFEHGNFKWDIAEAYYRTVLDKAEQQTYDNIKGDILNGR